MAFGVQTSGMKKKTVITTEKREVWIVRRPIAVSEEPADESQALASGHESRPVRCDELPARAQLKRKGLVRGLLRLTRRR